MTVLTVRHDSLQTTVHVAVSDPAEHLICQTTRCSTYAYMFYYNGHPYEIVARISRRISRISRSSSLRECCCLAHREHELTLQQKFASKLDFTNIVYTSRIVQRISCGSWTSQPIAHASRNFRSRLRETRSTSNEVYPLAIKPGFAKRR